MTTTPSGHGVQNNDADQQRDAERASRAMGRLITVEEHVSFGDLGARVRELAAEPVPPADTEFASFIAGYFRAVGDGSDIEQRLAHMDAVGVDLQVLSSGNGSPAGLDHPDAVELCRTVNDRLAAVVGEHPTRFAAFATLPLVHPQAASDELRRCVGELGFKGWLSAGTFHGQFLDHPRFRPVLATAAGFGVPVYVHPGLVAAPVRTSYYTGDWSRVAEHMFSTSGFGWHVEAGIHVLRLMVAGVLDELPGLKLLSGHWGETVPGYLDRLDEQLGMAFPDRDRSLSQTYRDQVWVTPSGLFNQAQLQLCLAMMGPDHIIWSEDQPYVSDLRPRLALAEADVTDEVRAKLAHGNAEALLGL